MTLVNYEISALLDMLAYLIFLIIDIDSIISDSDVPPIYIDEEENIVLPIISSRTEVPLLNKNVAKCLVLRALNNNQIFLLKDIDSNYKSLNSFLRHLCNDSEKHLSTLKFNARIMKDLNLIRYGTKDESFPVKLTHSGKAVLKILQD